MLILDWFASIPFYAAPFLLATTGLIINERAGVLNLGAEGIISMGAVLSIMTMLAGGNAAAGVAVAVLASVCMACVFVFLVVVLRIDQVLGGLVTFALGVGLSGFVGSDSVNQPVTGISPLVISPWLPLPPMWQRFLIRTFSPGPRSPSPCSSGG